MYQRVVFLYVAVLCSTGFSASSQTRRIDSLRLVVLNLADGRQKLTALRALCDENHSLNTDTLHRYATEAKTLALQFKDNEALAYAEQDLALCYAGRKQLDTALQLVAAQRRLVNSTKTPALHLSLMLTQARLLYRNNQYKEALEGLFAVLTEAEHQNNVPFEVMASTGIGWLQLDMKQYNDALLWFHRALNTAGNQPYLQAYGALFSNLATTHQTLGHIDSALYYSYKAIENARRNENLNFLATALRIQADIFLQQKRYKEAEAALKEAVNVRSAAYGPYFIHYDMSLLAQLYAQTGQPAKGIALCRAVIDSSHKTGITSQLPLIYDALAANYKTAGNYKAYGETLERSKALQDSLYAVNSSQLLAGLKSKYEIQKKENIIIQQKLDLVQKNLLFYGVLALLFFGSFAGVVLFRQNRKRQQLQLQLLREEERRKGEKAVLLAEEAERKRISADLHDSLGAYAASIASNIHQLQAGAGSHQRPELKELQSNAQAIVSQLSDTIWVLKKDALLLTSISDRLKLFIQKIAPSYPAVTIDVIEDIETDYLLPPAQAFHLFQIISEAVINALKHSGCTEVGVRLTAGSIWRVTVADNGQGLQPDKVLTAGGNGLPNMKQRASESGWNIEWQHPQAGGTAVIIEPTTN